MGAERGGQPCRVAAPADSRDTRQTVKRRAQAGQRAAHGAARPQTIGPEPPFFHATVGGSREPIRLSAAFEARRERDGFTVRYRDPTYPASFALIRAFVRKKKSTSSMIANDIDADVSQNAVQSRVIVPSAAVFEK